MAREPDRAPGQLLGAIFSASPDAIVVIDESGAIVLSSPGVTQLFGYFPEELVGEPVEILIPSHLSERHSEHIRNFFLAPRSRQMGAGLELAGQHRMGETFAVDVSLAPVEVRGKRFAAAFVRDASDRKRAVDRLRAVNEITQQLLSGSALEAVFPEVARRARVLSRSDAVWIVTPTSAGSLEVTSVDGPGTEALLGVTLSPETSRSAQVMATRISEVIEDLSVASNVPTEVGALGLGPGIYVPMVADQRRLGTLVLARVRGAPVFEPVDTAFAEVFASSIAAAIEIGEARSEVDRLGIVAEDERIARDLHDTVIQQLFALGMSLQATRSGVTGPAGDRIDVAVDALDAVIKEIRNTIFRLPGRTEQASGLRDEMLRLADKFRDELGFLPRVAFDGPVDLAVPEVVATHLLQVFGEGLSNISHHAHASMAEAIVNVNDECVVFSLVDDGVGIPDGPHGGDGLRNMSTRASNLGGTFTTACRQPRGTILEWRVPL